MTDISTLKPGDFIFFELKPAGIVTSVHKGVYGELHVQWFPIEGPRMLHSLAYYKSGKSINAGAISVWNILDTKTPSEMIGNTFKSFDKKVSHG